MDCFSRPSSHGIRDPCCLDYRSRKFVGWVHSSVRHRADYSISNTSRSIDPSKAKAQVVADAVFFWLDLRPHVVYLVAR